MLHSLSEPQPKGWINGCIPMNEVARPGTPKYTMKNSKRILRWQMVAHRLQWREEHDFCIDRWWPHTMEKLQTGTVWFRPDTEHTCCRYRGFRCKSASPRHGGLQMQSASPDSTQAGYKSIGRTYIRRKPGDPFTSRDSTSRGTGTKNFEEVIQTKKEVVNSLKDGNESKTTLERRTL